MVNRDIYISLYNTHLDKKSEHDQQIKLDIDRTYTKFNFYKNKKNIEKLFNVLHVLACDNLDFGYTQGFNFIVGYFLMRHDGDEIKTFKLITSFLKNDKYGLKGLFIDEFPKLFLTKYQITKLIEKYLPELDSYFKNIKLDMLSWLSSWILTLFAKNLEQLNLIEMNKFFDYYIKEGWIVVIKFCMIILEQTKSNILTKDFSELLVYFNDKIWDDLNLENIDELIKNNPITLYELVDLEIEYVKNLSKPQKKQKKKLTKTEKNIIIGGSSAFFAGLTSLIVGLVLSKK